MLKHYKRIELKGQHLGLLAEKALFWEEERILMVSDLHIGKVGHFRKSGIAVPRGMEQADLAVLSDLIHTIKPEKVFFLGDLFHSEHNNDWTWLTMWTRLHADVEMVLIRGNHDILKDQAYAEAGIKLVESLSLGVFSFCHEPADCKGGGFFFCGHIHPAVRLQGKGRQSEVFPCFYFREHVAILPAFGRFTGSARLKVQENDRIFIVAGGKVLEV